LLDVVIFNIILGGLAAPVNHHNTGCFTCNAVKINFYSVVHNENMEPHIKRTRYCAYYGHYSLR